MYLIQSIGADKERKSEGEVGGDMWLRQRLSMLYQLRNRPSLIAWALDDSSSRAPTPQISALQDSLKALDPSRPIIDNSDSKAIYNFPSSAPKLEQLTPEDLLKLKKEYQPVGMKSAKTAVLASLMFKILVCWIK